MKSTFVFTATVATVLGSALAISPSLALAADTAASTSNTSTTLPEVTVTATRIPTRSSALVSDVTVISREQIAASSSTDVLELLQSQAGLQISANGGAGQLANVFTRGTNSNHTLLLIDGVRYSSVSTGFPNWANIPLANIERIEVLKGPASALYGSDAVGGVVQIFTRKAQTGFHPSVSLSAGTSYAEASANLAGGNDSVDYNLALSHKRDKSLSATNTKAGPYTYAPDRDGYTQDNVSAGLTWKITPDWRLGATVQSTHGLTHFDDGANFDGSYPDSQVKLKTEVASIFVDGRINPWWKTKLSYGSSKDGSDTTVSSYGPSFFNSTVEQTTWQNDFATPLGTAIAGLERLSQNLDSSTLFDQTNRSTDSAFAGLTGKSDAHSWQANVRHDKNSQFGSANTWYAGYGYQVTPALRLKVSQGTSFVAPSFNYLYYPNYSNPNLQAERGTNTELGAEYVLGEHEFKLSAYQNKVSNLIVSNADTNYVPNNVGKAKLNGADFVWDTHFDKTGLHFDYHYLRAVDAQTGEALPRRAPIQARLALDYPVNAWKLGAELQYTASRADSYYDDATYAQVPVTLAPYTLLNLRASYALAKDWRVTAKLNNVTNKKYETVYGYNQAGRGVFFTLTYQPK